MPQAVQADWPLIQTLYASGQQAKAISLQTGVSLSAIQTRAHRGNWRRLAAHAKEIVKVFTSEQSGDSESDSVLASHSQRARRGLAGVLARSVEQIEQMPIPTGKAALKAAAALVPLVANCKTVYGWADSPNSSPVRVQILAQTAIIGADGIAQEPSPPNKHPFSTPSLQENDGGGPLEAGGGLIPTPHKILEVFENSDALVEKGTWEI